MIFCTNCGKQLEDGTAFCTGCGTPVAAVDSASSNASEQPSYASAEETASAEPAYQAPQYQQSNTYSSAGYGQQTYQQQSYQQQGYSQPDPPQYHTTVINTAPSIPPEYTPLGAWAYFGYSILFAIPLVGLILLIVFACGGAKNINLRNYARSFFCWYAIAAIILVLILIISAIIGASVFHALR